MSDDHASEFRWNHGLVDRRFINSIRVLAVPSPVDKRNEIWRGILKGYCPVLMNAASQLFWLGAIRFKYQFVQGQNKAFLNHDAVGERPDN